jgi:hypothetical protein
LFDKSKFLQNIYLQHFNISIDQLKSYHLCIFAYLTIFNFLLKTAIEMDVTEKEIANLKPENIKAN